MESVETNMKLLEDNLSTYNGTMDTFYRQALSKIEIIKGLITTIRSDIEQYQIIQKQYNDSQAYVQALQSQIEGLQSDIKLLQEANRKLSEEQNADQQLRLQLEALQKELENLREEQTRLEQQLGIAKRENDEKNRRIDEYASEIKAKDDEIAQLRSEIDDNQRRLDEMVTNLRNAERALDEERGRERGLEEQMKAYGDRIVELNTILQKLSGDPRAEEVQKGLDDIIEQLRGLTNNSGSDVPGQGPASGGLPERSSRINSSSAPAGEGTNSGSTPTPGPNSDSRPGTVDSESTKFQIGPLGPLGDTTLTSEERSEHVDGNDILSSSSEEQQILPPGGRLKPISRSAHKVVGVDKITKKDISIEFPPDVHGEDVKARRATIKNIVDKVYKNMNFTDDQKVKKIVKGKEVIDYPHTIRMAASVGTMTRDDKLKMRKMVREKLMEWQNTHERHGIIPFKNFYLPINKYSYERDNHDPFNVEFPYYDSKNYKIPMNRASSRGGKTKRKKTRRKQGGKSKNKTIRYKRRKNRKQSKK